MLANGIGKIYFIGIYGSFMRSLALISARRGVAVCGSDGACVTECDFDKYGIRVYKEHCRENLIEFSPDAVVYSMAIGDTNPELAYAREANIPIFSRAEYASLIVNEYPMNVAVAGSHGKSTVTAMLFSAITAGGINAGVISGAKTEDGKAFSLGSELIVYEACEYKNSFLSFSPDIAVVSNLELDHTDFFRSLSDIKNSFLIFINSAKRFAVLNADDENLVSLFSKIKSTALTVGKAQNADFRYERYKSGGKYRLRIYRNNLLICDLAPHLAGEHNAFNIAAAVAVCYLLGVDKSAYFALESFLGIARRCEKISKINSTDIIYDYAHHPTEINATLSLLQEKGYKKIMTVFAPHTYSRTAFFMDAFAQALSRAGRCVIADIFAAREKAQNGVSAEILCQRINSLGTRADCLSDYASLSEIGFSEYDCVVLMGAGDLDKVKSEIFEIEKSRNGENK